jgi:enhancing lycopene biosynthesis protein 2
MKVIAAETIMKKVAVVLAGCGVYDGAEISEAVLTLLSLEQQGASYQCIAPDIDQMHVVNHLTGEPVAGETRNVLVEAARIARGNVLALGEAKVDEFDALIVPGGFGAAKNLCSFAVEGADMTVLPEFLDFARAFRQAGKPIEARVDAERKLVTTPAFMLAGSVSEAYSGISECVREVLAIA